MYILSFAPLSTLVNLEAVSKDWAAFYKEHSAQIYRNAAVLHGVAPFSNATLDDALLGLGGDIWKDEPVKDWKELCAWSLTAGTAETDSYTGRRHIQLEMVCLMSYVLLCRLNVLSRTGKPRRNLAQSHVSFELQEIPCIVYRSMRTWVSALQQGPLEGSGSWRLALRQKLPQFCGLCRQ